MHSDSTVMVAVVVTVSREVRNAVVVLLLGQAGLVGGE